MPDDIDDASGANSAPSTASATKNSTPAEGDNPGQSATKPNSDGTDVATRIARAFLEDFVVTALLRQGRALKSSELAAAAEGFTVSRMALREGLAQSRRVSSQGRAWDLALRVEWQSRSRDERARRPLDRTL